MSAYRNLLRHCPMAYANGSDREAANFPAVSANDCGQPVDALSSGCELFELGLKLREIFLGQIATVADDRLNLARIGDVRLLYGRVAMQTRSFTAFSVYSRKSRRSCDSRLVARHKDVQTFLRAFPSPR